MTNDQLENVKHKIRSLLAKTTANGCSEAEASTAMGMAMGLMAKYGIENDSLGKEKLNAKQGARNSKQVVDRKYIYQAAGVLYGCKFMTYDSGRSGFCYIGRQDNMDMAEVTATWLVEQVDVLCKAAYNAVGITGTDPRVVPFRKNFREACGLKLLHRAQDLVANPVAIAETTGQNALVMKGYFEKLSTENEEYVSKMSNVIQTKARPKKWGIGAGAGYAAGDSVKLRKEI